MGGGDGFLRSGGGSLLMGVTFLYSSSSASRPANTSLSKASSDIAVRLFLAFSLLAGCPGLQGKWGVDLGTLEVVMDELGWE